MSGPWRTRSAFLGTGGETPRLERLDITSWAAEELLRLPTGCSAYALDVSPLGTALAVGTRMGPVYIFREEGGQPRGKKVLQHHAGVLAVCFMSETSLVVSDTVRRCILWSGLDNGRIPNPLDTRDETVCALRRISDSMLVGLTTRGTLLSWRFPGGQLMNIQSAGAPPPMSALVRLVYWPAEQAVAYPARNGYLVLVSLDAWNTRTLAAHQGEFYAVAVLGDDLVTAGRKDQRLRSWQARTHALLVDLAVPEGIISAAVVDSFHKRVLFIRDSGQAGIYTVQSQAVDMTTALDGIDYRVVIGPAPEGLQALAAEQKHAEARSVTEAIEARIARRQFDGTEKLHERLSSLGQKEISLSLRVKQAVLENDIIAELKARTQLVGMLPTDESALEELEAYATLLEKVWAFQEAESTYKRILAMQPSHPACDQLSCVSQRAEATRGTNWVLMPDEDLQLVVDSATVLNRPFTGRIVVNMYGKIAPEAGHFPPTTMTEAFERARKTLGDNIFPKATYERLWIVSRADPEKSDTLTFGYPDEGKLSGLQFALLVHQGHFETAVVPMVLLDARRKQASGSVAEHNRRVLEALEEIRARTSVEWWLDDMCRYTERVVSGLMNEKGHAVKPL